MTDPHEEHGEILRRALNAEADTVTPSADGLERIRTRIEERRHRRFGWAWFTESWARPVLAVGAAVAIAGIGVSAPQTVNLFTSPAGHNGSTAGGNQAPPSTVTNAQGQPNGSQTQGPPPPSQNGKPANSQSPTPPSSSSTSACRPPGGGDGGSPPQSASSPEPESTEASKPTASPCASAPAPTAPPPSSEPPDKPTDKPTKEPEPSVTPTPTASEQSANEPPPTSNNP
ncbi:hypothetical protein [Actinomadura rudentiformis]|uniref:Uncharacterized protein n=1 Tax=Actinomadura rudentiformis TaxID=359158 RepID=A0A6H9YPT0_9ACTN|nr:hypothetical protein [Actinomadura rudentiformis]KAB2345600.1 hypothetical protein F8566_27045 [Actinomadura rudentiformis]